MSMQRPGGTATALWRALPPAGRVVVSIVGVVAVFYVWQIVLGLFVLAALGVGTVQIVKWFATKR